MTERMPTKSGASSPVVAAPPADLDRSLADRSPIGLAVRAGPATNPASVRAVIGSAGHPLEATVRRDMESRFGCGFAGVRVHTDDRAAESAKSVSAQAYTVGERIAFGAGQYAPSQSGGRRLIAHELAHVVQQRRGGSDSTTTLEGSAAVAAESAAAGRQTAVRGGSPPRLLRQEIVIDAIRNYTDAELDLLSPEAAAELLPRVQRKLKQFQAGEGFGVFFKNENAQEASRLTHIVERLQRRVSVFTPANPLGLPFLTPKPTAPVKAAAPAAPKASPGALEKFVLDHPNLQSDVMLWQDHFITGLGRSKAGAATAEAWRQAKAKMSSAKTAGDFFGGVILNVPIGAGKEIFDIGKSIAELVLKGFALKQKFEQDPAAFLKDAKKALTKFIDQLPDLIGKALDAETIGASIGDAVAGMITEKFLNRPASDQGQVIGEVLGRVLLEIALLFLGPEDLLEGVSAVARAAKGGPMGREVLAALQKIPEAEAMLEARGITKVAKTGGEAGGAADSRLLSVTDAELDAAFDAATTPEVKGGKKPTIDGRRVPTNSRQLADLQDIRLRPGETQAQGLARVRQVIGQKISDTPLGPAWERARTKVLKGRNVADLGRDEMIRPGGIYDQTRDAFWIEVQKDSTALGYVNDAGFAFSSKSGAPLLQTSGGGLSAQEVRVSLDHVAEKAIGENWRRSVDADNLVFETQNANSAREIKQMRHPELRDGAGANTAPSD